MVTIFIPESLKNGFSVMSIILKQKNSMNSIKVRQNLEINFLNQIQGICGRKGGGNGEGKEGRMGRKEGRKMK